MTLGEAPRILQPAIPEDQRQAASRPLPGIQPLNGSDWLTVDVAYGPQLAERARLLTHRRSAVLACEPCAEAAVCELLDEVLTLLEIRPDFEVGPTTVTRPDGVTVAVDRNAPLDTLSRLVTEDLCLLQKKGDEHVLTAALLCFPASWTLAEKIGKPLITLHAPVAEYNEALARRVQRLFDGVKVGRPIWRANLLKYDDPDLHQPRLESDRRPIAGDRSRYERSERQVLWRLPKTGAVVFSIHTSVALIHQP